MELSSKCRSCAKIEVVVLGSPSITVLMVFVDVKQHWKKKYVDHVKFERLKILESVEEDAMRMRVMIVKLN